MLTSLASAGSFLSGLGSIGSAFGIGGGGANRKDASRAAWESADIQKHLWYNQLPMLTEGAKKAGLHPLVAAGVNPASGPTVGVVGDSGPSPFERMKEMGQGIGRAAEAFSTKEQRAASAAATSLSLEKMKLENDLLRSQITTINRPTTPPISGNSMGSNQGAEYSPVELNTPTGFYGSKEGGATTDFTYSRTPSGGLTIVPSADVKQRIEDMTIPQLQWSFRNTHILSTPPRPDPKEFPLPDGHIWRWHNTKQEWRPFKQWKF